MFFRKTLGKKSPIDYVIVGLGNPGRQYAETRHNIGFMVVDALAERHGIRTDRVRFQAKTGDGRISGKRVLLMKPQSYMNLSGGPVQAALRHYRVEPQNVLVIVDDVALPPGKLRIRLSGSAGGHNGLKSIIAAIGEEFPRVRVGIGKPENHEMIDWVISKFAKAERPVIDAAVAMAADAVECALVEGAERAGSKFNGKTAG
ncbi:aminoacyl-tRNA hydrolase [Oscillospiraceae bacterium OttesenSCG-928-F05]|nr:aminoacyl-tRNA hydrolase [Oscillospiraceae bacterium OttesenSCG-928-F05]